MSLRIFSVELRVSFINSFKGKRIILVKACVSRSIHACSSILFLARTRDSKVNLPTKRDFKSSGIRTLYEK